MLAANRVGKALRHGTRVATPAGWRTVESLAVGDLAVAGDGSVTRVVGVYPQGEVPLYALAFDRHHVVETCAEHRWLYQPPRARYPTRRSHGRTERNPFYGEWTIGTTAGLARFGRGPRMRAVVPVAAPFDLPARCLPLDPYALGVLLGDGCFSSGTVRVSTADPEILDALRAAGFVLRHYGRYDYGVNGAAGVIRRLGLMGIGSGERWVPDEYLTSCTADRLALLQGLMDTDGSVHGPGGACEYATTSDRLADAVEWLGASLGMKVRRVRRQTRAQNGRGAPSWRLHIRSAALCLFRLPRKVARWRPLRETENFILHGVRPVGRGLATCIEVAHPSHTFVIEHGIVTHNTEGVGGYETVLHLTGLYPEWWTGKRFTRPVKAWAAGDTSQTTRDILQVKLLGAHGQHGTGLIPGDLILRTANKQGTAEAVEQIHVRHVSGGISVLQLKSYEQGREAFQGTEQDLVWLDEEPPLAIYSECLIRLMTTGGILLCTFTPLEGLSETVLQYLPEGDFSRPAKYVVQATWDDVPHLSQEVKDALWKSLPPHQRDARSKGVPQLGSGAIYPVPESEIVVEPFEIPPHWPRAYGMDVGWNRTAAVWGAVDRDAQVLYLYAEHYRGQAEPSIHADAIKARGAWIPGVIDPASRGRNQTDGAQFLSQYRELGLDLMAADNAVEAGIYAVWQRLSGGRLKVFRSLQNWLAEYRLYRRDEKGRVVKERDHLQDCTRYLCMSGLQRACVKPEPVEPVIYHGEQSWLR